MDTLTRAISHARGDDVTKSPKLPDDLRTAMLRVLGEAIRREAEALAGKVCVCSFFVFGSGKVEFDVDKFVAAFVPEWKPPTRVPVDPGYSRHNYTESGRCVVATNWETQLSLFNFSLRMSAADQHLKQLVFTFDVSDMCLWWEMGGKYLYAAFLESTVFAGMPLDVKKYIMALIRGYGTNVFKTFSYQKVGFSNMKGPSRAAFFGRQDDAEAATKRQRLG